MPPADPKTILVVDDEPDIQEVARIALEMEDYRVEMAANGLEALEMIAVSMPDLVLLDVKMPVMDGWAFAREFQVRYDHRVPIIVMTAAADARMRAREMGATGWIGKPFDLDELVEAVGRHLGRP